MTEARRVVVRYRTKPEHADENQRLVEAVFAALGRRRPEQFRYATFRLDDGVSFMHVASVETDDGANPLDSLEEFQAFTKDIAARCDEPPVVQVLALVGSYRLFETEA